MYNIIVNVNSPYSFSLHFFYLYSIHHNNNLNYIDYYTTTTITTTIIIIIIIIKYNSNFSQLIKQSYPGRAHWHRRRGHRNVCMWRKCRHSSEAHYQNSQNY